MTTLNLTNNTMFSELANAIEKGVELTFENKALNDWQKEVVAHAAKYILGYYDDDLCLGDFNQTYFAIRKVDGEFSIENENGLWVDFEGAMKNPTEWWDEDWNE
jgi:hypothetical protein